MTLRARLRSIAALAFALTAGCGYHAPTEPVRAQAPDGIILPAGVKPGDDVDGVYVGASRSGVWLAPRATLHLRKDRPSSSLALIIYVPDTTERQRSWYHAHPLTVEGRFDGGNIQRRCCFSGGVGSADFTVPPALRNDRGALRLRIDVRGGVAEPGVNASGRDKRRLALVLVRLFFY